MEDVLGPDVLSKLQQQVLDWYEREGRDLPWRNTSDSYAVLVAEVMLQQTRVDRVLPKYQEFLRHFDTFETLAKASRSDVIRIWSTLGYNRRAVRLHNTARQVVEHWNGQLPYGVEALERLPGIGRYTASAVACFAQGQDLVVVDTNIRRVLNRVFFGVLNVSMKKVEEIATKALPRGQAWVWNQALMDVGAIVCRTSKPLCDLCPLQSWCQFTLLHIDGDFDATFKTATKTVSSAPFRESQRYYRGRVIESLRGLNKGDYLEIETLGSVVKPDCVPLDMVWFRRLINGLEADGLVKLNLLGENDLQQTILVSLFDEHD